MTWSAIDTRYALSDYVRFVHRSEGVAVYHSLLGGLCLVDKAVAEILEGFRGGVTVTARLAALPARIRRQGEIIMDIFAAKGFLVAPEDKEYARIGRGIQKRLAERLSRGSRVGVIQLVVTNSCNYRCTYCFINQGHTQGTDQGVRRSTAVKMMTAATALTGLDGVIGLLRENGKTSLAVQFFGGEPLLNPGTVRSVLEHYGCGEHYGIAINYSIVTNGSLVNDAIVKLFAQYGVTVIISLDSISPEHDQRRTAKGGSGAERVAENVARLRAAGVTVIFNTVLSEETFNGFSPIFIDQSAEYGIGEIGVLLDLNADFYMRHTATEIVEKLWAFYLRGKEMEVVVTGYLHTAFQRMFQFNQLERVGYKTCSATGCQLSIEPDGEVFACKASSGHFGHIGNLKKLVAGETYRRYAMRAANNAADCMGCEIENFCSGLCLGPVEKKYGTVNAIEKSACDVYRLLVRQLVADADAGAMERYGIYFPA